MNYLRGWTTREHQVPKPPPVARSISNKERGGPHERTLSKKIPQKEKFTS